MGEKEINKKHKVWAVVCGAVRQEFELYSILSYLCEYRSKGYIEGIVLSTWVGEADNVKNLREKLKFLDIKLVETPPLSEEIGRYANLNYTRQALQLLNGLKNIPDDVFVLKCRTDFCMKFFKYFDDVICNPNPLKPNSYGDFRSIFEYKVAVIGFGISHSFASVDICFFGYKLDVLKMCSFNLTQLTIENRLMPDCLFFLSPFLSEFQILKSFFIRINYWELAKSLKEL